MQSKIVEEEKKELPFPKLMKSTVKELVILATGNTEEYIVGTAVYSNGHHAVTLGYRSSTWMSEIFEDFDGTIELSN